MLKQIPNFVLSRSDREAYKEYASRPSFPAALFEKASMMVGSSVRIMPLP